MLQNMSGRGARRECNRMPHLSSCGERYDTEQAGLAIKGSLTLN